MPLQELLELAETTSATVRNLEDKGLVTVSAEISERDPYAGEHILPHPAVVVEPATSPRLTRIKEAIDAPASKSEDAGAAQPDNAGRVFLLHGVTGSGKTEVYLQAIAHALEQGRGAIVLVPEISLTPQTVERFKARFSSGPLQTLVAVLHSHLSAGERHDEWHKIRQGRARIVMGRGRRSLRPSNRSASSSWTRNTSTLTNRRKPRANHARDVAIVRGRMEGAPVVLGSATPSLESFTIAARKIHAYRNARARGQHQDALVRVVDMRQSMRRGKGIPIFSPQLKDAMTLRLERGEQTILFLNRRGFSTSLQCTQCGYVAEWPELQRLAHLSSQGAKTLLPRLQSHGGCAARLSQRKVPQPGHPILRAGDGEGGGHARQVVSDRAHQTHGLRRVETQGRLPPHPRRFSHRQN